MGEINVWAVLVAAIASFIFGALWYSPLLCLKPWCRESGVDPDAQITNPAKVYGITFVLTFITAFAFAFFVGPHPKLGAAVGTGVGAGICFVAASMAINYQFANRSLLLWAIDSGFHTVRFILMGIVIGLWH